MKVIVRRTMAHFIAEPKLADGTAATPSSITIVVRYTDRSTGDPMAATVTMEDQNDGTWAGQWDTTPATAGSIVYYSALGVGDGIKAAQDGRFQVDSNPANETQ